MTRYRHPEHGFHIAGYGDDLAALEAAGWVPDTEPDPLPTAVIEPVAPAPEPPRREPWRPKRGR